MHPLLPSGSAAAGSLPWIEYKRYTYMMLPGTPAHPSGTIRHRGVPVLRPGLLLRSWLGNSMLGWVLPRRPSVELRHVLHFRALGLYTACHVLS